MLPNFYTMGLRPVTALSNLAEIHRLQGNYQESRASIQEAFLQAEGNLEPAVQLRLAYAHNQAGILDSVFGLISSAMTHYDQAEAAAIQLQNEHLLAATQSNKARLYSKQGNWYEALQHYQEAQRLYSGLSDVPRDIGVMHMHLGSAYAARRQWDEATEHHRVAREHFQEFGDPILLIMLDNHQGIVAFNQGHTEEALRFYESALDQLPKDKGHDIRQAALNNMGLVYIQQGEYGKTIKVLEKALKMKPMTPEFQVSLLSTLGTAQYHDQEDSAALETLTQAEELARTYEFHPKRWRILHFLASIHRTQDNAEDAKDCWEQAVFLIEQLRYDLGGSDPQRLEFMLDKRTVYASLANLLIEQNQDLEKAFEYLQRAKARTFLDMLYGAGVDLRTGVDADLLEQEQSLATQLASVRWELAHVNEATRKNELENQALKLEEERLQVRDYLRETNPKYHELFRGQTASLTQVQAQLAPDEVLLDFFVTEDRIFLFSISPTAAQVHRIPLDRKKLVETVDEICKVVAFSPQTGINAQSSYRQFVESSQQLYASLLGPAEKMMQEASHLIIAPHDVLYQVPFAALLVSEPDGDGRQNVYTAYQNLDYLVRHYSVSYVPSASVFWRLMKQAPQFTSSTKRIALGLPEPVLNSETGVPPVGIAEMAMLEQLSHIQVYTGGQATEAQVKALSNESLDIAHFALHGFFNDAQPLRSYLQLGASPSEDGHLYAYEVVDMGLDARLVALSACVTARRPSTSGEGMVGLTRAFLAAGVQSVLASYWYVDDVPTTSLLRSFYDALGGGTGYACTLRQAQLDAISATPTEGNQSLKGQASAHPHYWAAFVVVGRTH